MLVNDIRRQFDILLSTAFLTHRSAVFMICAGGLTTCVGLWSCALPAQNPRLTLRVNIAPDANSNAPVPVDLVFVWDKAVAAEIKGLTASDWFARKAQFRHDDPDGKALTTCEWEWVPGQEVPDINVVVPAAARSWVQGAFVFANYRAAGSYRYQVAPGATTALNLLDSRVESQSQPLGKEAKLEYVVLSSVAACDQSRVAPQ
jgi:type VI secretion system protein